uniref:Uncharacterized protein n=1 Tax=Steinernema glaseri TaxID=37863 RepID=A0A1I7ZJ94_9BILA
MLVLLLLATLLGLSSAWMPEFDDPFLGTLVVSKRQFPLLTLEDHPELAHVFPTDQQLDKIWEALKDQWNYDDLYEDWYPRNPEAAFDRFEESHRASIGKFIASEFSYKVLNSSVTDRSQIPFDTLDQDAYFKVIVVDRARMEAFLDNEFNYRMRHISMSKKPWIPAEKLIQEMKECQYFKYGSASDEDFKYNKDSGGTMVYYKVSCMSHNDFHYIGLSYYDNEFVLQDIERSDVVKSKWSFLGLGKAKTATERWFEKSFVTISDLKLLLDFIRRELAEPVRKEYGQYLNAASIRVRD